MKIRKNILLTLLAVTAILFYGCNDGWDNPLEEFPKGGLVRADFDTEQFNLFSDLSQAEVGMNLTPTDANGNEGELIDFVEISVQYQQASSGFVSEEMLLLRDEDPRGRRVFDFENEIVGLFAPLDLDSLDGGDGFIFTFRVTMLDGRVFGPENTNAEICGQDNARGTCTKTVFLVCPSEIPLGNWITVQPTDDCNTFQVGGITTVLSSTGSANYEFSNFDFGYFGNCCGPIRAQFIDLCNNLTLTGATEFGITWTGNGVYEPNGGANGNGRITFLCHFDGTFGGPAAVDSIILDAE